MKTADAIKINHSNLSKYLAGLLSEKITRKVDLALLEWLRHHDTENIIEEALKIKITVPQRLSIKRSRDDENVEVSKGSSVIETNDDNITIMVVNDDSNAARTKPRKMPINDEEENLVEISDQNKEEMQIEEDCDNPDNNIDNDNNTDNDNNSSNDNNTSNDNNISNDNNTSNDNNFPNENNKSGNVNN